MRKILLRPAAERDLAELYAFIARESGNLDRAIGYVRRVREWCAHLALFPETGRQRNDLRLGLRIITFERRVVIAYEILPSGDVEIGRFLYGGRNYEAIIRSQP